MAVSASGTSGTPLTIVQAQLTINVLRVGTKQLTKAVWNQIPTIDPFDALVEGGVLLGKVRGVDNGGYLYSFSGDPRKLLFNTVAIPPEDYILTTSDYCSISNRWEWLNCFTRNEVNEIEVLWSINRFIIFERGEYVSVNPLNDNLSVYIESMGVEKHGKSFKVREVADLRDSIKERVKDFVSYRREVLKERFADAVQLYIAV